MGPKGPQMWPKATCPPQELEGGVHITPNLLVLYIFLMCKPKKSYKLPKTLINSKKFNKGCAHILLSKYNSIKCGYYFFLQSSCKKKKNTKNIKGVWAKDGDKIIRNPKGPLLDMSDLPTLDDIFS
jgi:hypothetical protein